MPLAVGIGGFQPRIELVAIQVQDRRQDIGCNGQIRHAHRAHVDRIDRLAHGENLQVAVEDGAAGRGDVHHLQLLLAGRVGVVLVAHYLEVE